MKARAKAKARVKVKARARVKARRVKARVTARRVKARVKARRVKARVKARRVRVKARARVEELSPLRLWFGRAASELAPGYLRAAIDDMHENLYSDSSHPLMNNDACREISVKLHVLYAARLFIDRPRLAERTTHAYSVVHPFSAVGAQRGPPISAHMDF
eukprot:6188066-Pleurochrysis_carterae.AAC.4